MIKNYFFLNRFIIEANEILEGSFVTSIFSQEKDILVIEFVKNKFQFYLEISVNPGFPFINLKENFNRAKKNTINIFSEILEAELISIEISDSDRIIRINSSKGSLYFLIRGKFTNVCFQSNNNELQYFKNPPDPNYKEVLLKELNESNFIKKYNSLSLIDNSISLPAFQKDYPVIGKEIISEAKSRCKIEDDQKIINEIIEIINEIKNEELAVFIDENNFQINLSVTTFHIFLYTSTIKFKNIIDAVGYYIGKRYYFEQVESKKKIIRKYLNKELSGITSKLNNLKILLDKGSREKEFNKYGNLLLINLALIKHGMKNIEVIDIYNDNLPLTIKLVESLSHKKNIDCYFDKARSEKIKIEKSKQLYQITSKRFLKLKELEEKSKTSKEIEDYNIIMKELKINDNSDNRNKNENLFNFKQYVIESKYHVFVGKDSKNNDLLTTKFAKQNDYWFHARSVPGSHVVLRVENSKEVMPKNILKKAASLAAFHSKAKTAGLVPVSFTQKKYVVKKKGMEAGKVALLKEDVLIVKPEIPQGCEYVAKE